MFLQGSLSHRTESWLSDTERWVKTVMIEIKATHRAPIKLGHTGENEAVRVAFSLLPFKETFPDGVPALLARRKGDATAYPVPLAVEEYTAYWTVTRADTEKAGFGQCELQWIVGNTLAKSDKFDFFVVKALEAGAEAPDAPSKAWFEAIQGQIGDLSKLTTEAKENLVAAVNEAARTGGGSGGGTIEMRVSDGYIQYSNDGVTWENLIAVSDLKGEAGPQGLKGDTGPQGPQGIPGEKGADGAAGKDGSDGYSPEATVTPINGGAKIIVKDRSGTTSANVMNGAQGPKGDKGDPGAQGPVGPKGDPGATDFSLGITGAQVGQIAKITAVDASGKPTKWEPVDMPSGGVSGDVTNIITYPVAQRYEVSDYYKYVSYTQATLNADGTLNESGIGFTTDYLPVIPGETLFLSNTVTTKVAFFSKSKEYIGQITVASGQTNYTVPENAALARFENQYNGGNTVRFECREKPQQGITRLKDLIFSPLYSSVDLFVTGDSNTYGYGLSDRENEGWAYLFEKMLATITEIHVGYMSPYAHALAYSGYGNGANFRTGSRLAIYTDAQSVTLNYDMEYSGTWKWYVNDVEQAETEKTISGLGDGVKKVEVRFTGGQTINPYLSISKTITVTNKALIGCGIGNCPIEAGHDWMVLMVGTNNRNGVGGMIGAGKSYLAYAGKGTYIVPFPNRKTDASYVASQAQVYGELTSTLRSINYEICDASDFGYAFIQDDSLYQPDMIHCSAKGHKAIANIVGGKLGFPVTSL